MHGMRRNFVRFNSYSYFGYGFFGAQKSGRSA